MNKTQRRMEAAKDERMTVKLATIRTALADYIRFAGCDCCADRERRDNAATVLAGLLEVPMYEDGSGYNFYQFCSDEELVAKLASR